MLRKLSSVVSVCVLAMAGGCGDDGNDATSSKPAATTGTQAATASLERFLLARGEEPGYQPTGPAETLSTAEEYAARAPNPQAIARRIRDEGFVSFVRRELQGKEGPGVTGLFVFKSAAGAKREVAAARRDVDGEFRGWTVKRFDVPGVPGAFGFTATKAGQRVGNVFWVEGRCQMTLGNADASSFVAPLTAGVQAVHRRVAGRCP